MYKEMQEKVFEGFIAAAAYQIMCEEDEAYPSFEELCKMYPTSKKMVRKYHRKAKEHEYRNPLAVVYFSRIAVVILAVISVTFGLLTTSPEVRAAINSTVVTWYDEYVKIDFSKDSAYTEDETETDVTEDETATGVSEDFKISDLTVGYIPEGFELVSEEENEIRRKLIYMSETGDHLVIILSLSDVYEIYSDAEDVDFESMTINGNEALVVYDKEKRSGSITMGNEIYTVGISSRCDKEVLIKMAENIK